MVIPSVASFMTPTPHTIGPDLRLDRARHMMRAIEIHHLPVVEDNQLVGMLSAGDVATLVLDDTVSDVMATNVTKVAGTAGLDEVLTLMQEGGLGSVVVTGAAGIEGIFTVTDALRAFGELLARLARNG